MSLVLATTTPGEPEIFASLQGEGHSTGRPVAFLRLSRCNLACVWCDTAYTWHFSGDNRPHRNGEQFNRKGNQITLEEPEVAARIAALGQDRLVITGGEPLLQSAALARMLDHLPDIAVEVETNGTVEPAPDFDERVDQYNVSPKLAHSGNPEELALVPQRMASWSLDERALFKFVIATPEDIEEVLALQELYAIPGSRIFLMPEGVDSKTLRDRASWLAQLCLEHGLRFSDRLHIHLYGDERGT